MQKLSMTYWHNDFKQYLLAMQVIYTNIIQNTQQF